jgi:excinuclease ABC subunit A
LFLLDEPTTGLHLDDVNRLIGVLNILVDNGNTVLTIEHNLDFIKVSDYIVDLGPDGGDGGGNIVASGTPEQVSESKESYTAKYLKEYLNND